MFDSEAFDTQAFDTEAFDFGIVIISVQATSGGGGGSTRGTISKNERKSVRGNMEALLLREDEEVINIVIALLEDL